LHATATELSRNTQQRCSYASGDVRSITSLENAVAKCISEYGRIDFVIAGAAGNFLCPIDQLSPNAFKSVVEIDLVRRLIHLLPRPDEEIAYSCLNISLRAFFANISLRAFFAVGDL